MRIRLTGMMLARALVAAPTGMTLARALVAAPSALSQANSRPVLPLSVSHPARTSALAQSGRSQHARWKDVSLPPLSSICSTILCLSPPSAIMSGCRTELSALTSMPLSTSRSTAPRLPNCAAAKSSSGPGSCSGRIFCSLRFFAAAFLEDMDRAVRGGCAGDGAPCVGRMRSAAAAEAVRQGSGQGRAGPGPGAAPRTGPPPQGGGQAATARGSAGGRQSGSKIPSQNVSVSCAARTAPAHDARARLATWPRRGGTQTRDGSLEHELAGTLNRTLNRTETECSFLQEGDAGLVRLRSAKCFSTLRLLSGWSSWAERLARELEELRALDGALGSKTENVKDFMNA